VNNIRYLSTAAPARRKPLPWLLAAALGMVLTTVATAAEISVIIPFSGGCPQTPPGETENTWTIDLSKSKKDTLKWTAMKTDVTPNVVYTGGYSIYFDPFKRGPKMEDDNKDGVIESGHLHDDVPLAEFKYTIVGDECLADPLDPRIRVQLD
jgi:hypothetical protein